LRYFSLQTGIGTSVGSELETVTGPSVQSQENLNEQVFVIRENTDAYNWASPDTINGSSVEESNIPHNGLGNEVERSAVSSVPADAPAAAVTPLTVSDRILVGHVHPSDAAAARDFFDSLSSYSHSVLSDGSTGIASGERGSEQVTTAHQLFPVSSFGTVDVPDDSQISVSSSIKGTDSDQSVVLQNCDITTFKDLVKVSDSNEGQNVVDNQHAIRNTSVVMSTPEQCSNARSSTESLRQLSLQINGLIEDCAQGDATRREDSELECRNQELAALLAAECQKCDRLNLQLKEYVSNLICGRFLPFTLHFQFMCGQMVDWYAAGPG
jgi:hypothetical protein